MDLRDFLLFIFLPKEVFFMKKIRLSDATVAAAKALSFKEKIEIARQLEKLNIDTIKLPAISNLKSDTLLVKTIASLVKNSVLSVGVGLSVDDIDAAAEALSNANKPSIRIEMPVSTVGMEYSCHIKAPKMLEMTTALILAAKAKGVEVEFCALDATRAEEDVLKQAIIAAADAGADIITVCDSAAEMLPDKFGEFVAKVNSYVENSGASLAVCCDNRNGLAAANAIIAVENGADAVTTDSTGEGVSLQTMAEIIRNCGESGGFSTEIKYTKLNNIIKQIDWIMCNSQNERSVVTVKDVDNGAISLDINDTKETVISGVKKLGYDLTEEDAVKVYEEFLRVAKKKNVGAKELEAIVASVALQVPPTYKLISYVINNGNIISASAQITLEKDGETLQGICIGDGPVDASFLAIEQIIGHRYELDDFQIQSVTEGKEAMGSAVVKLRSNGKLYSGNGISTDIMGASIRAYINAVNKIVYEEGNR